MTGYPRRRHARRGQKGQFGSAPKAAPPRQRDAALQHAPGRPCPRQPNPLDTEACGCPVDHNTRLPVSAMAAPGGEMVACHRGASAGDRTTRSIRPLTLSACAACGTFRHGVWAPAHDNLGRAVQCRSCLGSG
jgi:hypothetical protein